MGGLNSKIFVKILEYIETQILCVHSPDGSIYDVVKKSSDKFQEEFLGVGLLSTVQDVQSIVSPSTDKDTI